MSRNWLRTALVVVFSILLVGIALSGCVLPTQAPVTLPPVISDVDVLDITDTSVTVIWTTDKTATSQVEYGLTTAYGLIGPMSQNIVTSHRMTLSGLSPNTTYHFRVKSSDGNGNEAVSNGYTFTTAKPPTSVGGIINTNTIWIKANSPYLITSTVQIPHGVTLTIEPGVIIYAQSVGVMFLLNGKIYARGTSENKIIFDGGGRNSFFSAQNRNPYTEIAFADFEYCIIKNGGAFWPNDGRGYFWLRHSELSNLSGESWIWYQDEDLYIEYNKFTKCGGFRIDNSGRSFTTGVPPATVYIRYNLFNGKSGDYCIFNEVSSGGSTIVSYNSFINMTGIVLSQGHYTSPNMSAPHNYWGTEDVESIGAMIYDKNDDINCPGYITYLPILTEPHPATPIP